ncbi:hypothetical protein PoB_001336400 [Plakobranchus ocellatus]|uniref:Uncharacterized protein n=1 Tax=Plakobranchus ocellatus TaxID=259542 RepID=A0AAV3YYP2_9GAST|nr:hypothetical protein PoB_001336400 [Plakobranchus ocellatus]
MSLRNRYKKLTPVNHANDIPAGLPTKQGESRFRYGLVLAMKPMLTYRTATNWNYPYSKQYSFVPAPVVGLPYDKAKPRRGRWGETLGTIISDNSSFIEEHWDEKVCPF